MKLYQAEIRHILISLKYAGKKRTPVITSLKRVSKPGLRYIFGAKNLPTYLR